jgi:uncharacterized membrane protein
MKPMANWTDEKTENIIGILLRAGVLLSGAIVLAGGILYLVHFGGASTNYRSFQGEPMALRTVGGVVHMALSIDSRGIMQFGLLLLILTPIARVVFSAFAFFRERDTMYVIVTLIVLAVLLYSLIGSR